MDGDTVIYVQRAPKGSPARYAAVSAGGDLLGLYERLSDISAYYRRIYQRGGVTLTRQLEKTYTQDRETADKIKHIMSKL